MRVATMSEAEALRVAAPKDDAGLGALRTERGNLPLDRIDVHTAITGLVARIDLTQEFVNVHDEALEATYVFPLPDRAAVTRMAMTADGRVVEAELQERGAARETYDRAVAAGQRASIAEEERPDVFTMRVGNILPGERVSVALSLAGPLSFEDGEATFRFPLVVAPRYIPGGALDGDSVGVGHALDTDAVPDASRITPPVLLPGFPNPLRLSIDVDIDPAGLPLGEVRSSLHTVQQTERTVSVLPGERANRDFVLRLAYGPGEAGLALVPDTTGEEGTYRLTVLPPASQAPPKPKDVVLLLDRSGSMGGWKMVAARRAAARIVDTLTVADRFAVLAFDDRVEMPASLPSGLVDGTDRHRFRAVEHLSRVDARGGTELLQPLLDGLKLLDAATTTGEPATAGGAAGGRDRVLVLVTDGQVGNEDQILRTVAGALRGVRVHTVGIDQAVNAGFLGRLAIAGGGRCELVESEDRLDEAMDRIHRRIGAPVVGGVTVTPEGLDLIDGTQAPARLPDVFPGVPFVVTGRYRGAAEGALTVAGTMRDGTPWSTAVTATRHDNPALTAIWARALLRDLEDAYVSGLAGGEELERRITEVSLRFQVLCRFTAYVAVDKRVVTEGGQPRQVVQPVETPAGWELPTAVPPPPLHPTAMPMAMPASAPYRSRSAAMPAPGGPPPMMPPMPAMTPPPPPMSGAPAQDTTETQRKAGGFRGGSGGGGFRPGSGAVGRALRGRGSVRPQVPPTAQPSVEAERQRSDAAELRELAAGEAQRLRDAAGRPEFERRELLEDLGSRLAVLGIGVLRVLAERLTPAAIAARPLEELWREVLAELDKVAGAGPEPAATRGAFWKR
ncbi:VIT domain-containing protein [Dactylosporangium sp. NPDC049525]|uniref:VIT domain-containing protein n=1 Tax=Dactylosporangium sp. NPDC049525 TaxID=3154730 RepID=UPI00342779E5